MCAGLPHLEKVEDAQVIVPAQGAVSRRHVDHRGAPVDVLVLVGLKQLGAGAHKLLHCNTRLVHPAAAAAAAANP
jgi:hypothetical protein